jgi:hypothetical protein
MTRTVKVVAAAVLAVGAMSLGACDENLSDLAGPTPNLEVSFASIQRDVFQSTDTAGRVACVTCHTATGRIPAGGLNLEAAVAYDQLVNRPSTQRPQLMRVLPGSPDDSYLVHKMDGAPGIIGRRMPFVGPPFLTSGQLTIVRRWIEVGAPRD